MSFREVGTLVGSSPHTRGARSAKRSTSRSRRIIPAYAGSTTSGATKARRRQDHPRIRGEHRSEPKFRREDGGSSPHTRGARYPRGVAVPARRIIPAYAGSTNGSPTTRPAATDHPRIRGEHRASGRDPGTGGGSSPHTRGARHRFIRRLFPARIIPAYAGSTYLSSVSCDIEPDHPRIRGEHKARPPSFSVSDGSSPHTRGARPRAPRVRYRRRIIPAYAGSTQAAFVGAHTGGDHPRIRGEHPVSRSAPLPRRTSSPHTRGAPTHPSSTVKARRIIPAYAGSTPSTRLT